MTLPNIYINDLPQKLTDISTLKSSPHLKNKLYTYINWTHQTQKQLYRIYKTNDKYTRQYSAALLALQIHYKYYHKNNPTQHIKIIDKVIKKLQHITYEEGDNKLGDIVQVLLDRMNEVIRIV